jgi:hypothetical protein
MLLGVTLQVHCIVVKITRKVTPLVEHNALLVAVAVTKQEGHPATCAFYFISPIPSIAQPRLW